MVETSRRILRAGGRFVTIYPADRGIDVIVHMRSANLEPKTVCLVHSRCDKDAKLILLEGIKGGNPGLKVLPPLVIYKNDGSYTEEVAKMFEP